MYDSDIIYIVYGIIIIPYYNIIVVQLVLAFLTFQSRILSLILRVGYS